MAEQITAANYAERISAFRAIESARNMEECKAIIHYLGDVDVLSTAQEDDQKYILAWKRSYGQVALAEAKIKADENEIFTTSFNAAALAAVRDAISKGYKGISLGATLEDDGKTVKGLVTHLVSTVAPKAVGTRTASERRATEYSYDDIRVGVQMARAPHAHLGYGWDATPTQLLALTPAGLALIDPAKDPRSKWSDGTANDGFINNCRWFNASKVIDVLGVDHASLAPYRRELPKSKKAV